MPKAPVMHFYDERRDGPLCGHDRRYADTIGVTVRVTCKRCHKKLDEEAA